MSLYVSLIESEGVFMCQVEITPKGWHQIDELHSYEVYQSWFWRGLWCGKLVDREGKTIRLFGMEQDGIGVSVNKTVAEEATKKMFELYKNI